MVYSIYVTGMKFSGKTALCLGLFSKFQEMGFRVGYFKPVGQGLKMAYGACQDPDVILMKEVMGLQEPLEDLSPLVLGKHYLDQEAGDCEKAKKRIVDAYERVSKDKDLLLIESAPSIEFLTCCGLDVGRLSKEFNAGVVLSVKGEDDFAAERAILYKQFIEHSKAKLIGAVLNLVPRQQIERMRGIVLPILERCGLEVLGVVPDHRELTLPTVQDVVEVLDAEVLTGKDRLETMVDGFLIGAMSPESAMSWLRRGIGRALITGGDRTDLILMALETKPSVIILTGNLYPTVWVLTTAEEKGIPVILVPDDTYTTVTNLEMLDGRILPSPTSTRKIQLTRQIVGEYVDWKRIIDEYVEWKHERNLE